MIKQRFSKDCNYLKKAVAVAVMNTRNTPAVTAFNRGITAAVAAMKR